MSAPEPLNPREDDRIWRRNASIIRQLYQEDKKTLKQVKTIMENERGFPETPLSVWEVKLRQLNMQKKLKARDWSLVYQHVRPRLQQEGKKKLIKPTAIRINGTTKPWDDCWREIRRNNALKQRPYQGLLPPLPAGIAIRTPSPELLETNLRMQDSESSQSLLFQLFQTAVVSLQPLFGLDSQPKAEASSDALIDPDSVYRLCLDGIPFTRVLEKMPDIIQGSSPSPGTIRRLDGSQQDQITSPFGLSNNLAAVGHSTSWKSQLTGIITHLLPPSESASPNGRDLGLNFDSHHYLSMVVYLLSNNYLDSYHIFDEYSSIMNAISEMTFRFVSRSVLLALLQSRLPSIRAAWEALLSWSGFRKNKEAFRVLIIVGMDNDWLEETVRGHEHLYHAVQNNCGDLIDALLARGCRADSSFGRRQRQTAIMAALENSDLDCAKLLIQNCDVNLNMESGPSNFAWFIGHFDETNTDHHHCLSFFLEQEADVDYKIKMPSTVDFSDWSRASLYMSTQNGRLSILDYVFYFHRQLFPKLAAFSKASQAFSRARALWCLEQGVLVLRDYLHESLAFLRLEEGFVEDARDSTDVPDQVNDWLEILLAEQLILSRYNPGRKVCCKTVQGLLELGADLQSLADRKLLVDDIFPVTADLVTSRDGPDRHTGLLLLQSLFKGDQGFQVQAAALSDAVEVQGIEALEFLFRDFSDLKKHGIVELAEAVQCSDFEATKLLLDEGVDPNTAARYGDMQISMFGLAAGWSTLAMMKYLVRRGAKPGNWKHSGQSSDISADMCLLVQTSEDLFAKVQYIIEEHTMITELSCPSAYLLDACLNCGFCNPQDRKRTFEYLFRKGAKLRPGSPLASWIAAGGGHQLVREMLDAGADLNAHSSAITDGGKPWVDRHLTPLQAAAGTGDYTLVCLLLERGADLNSPVLGRHSTTALHAICAWDPVRPEERMRKDRIITLLLEKGADVNAVTSAGHTALHWAAKQGDLSTAFILLKHRAKIDAMVRYNPGHPHTALDMAASFGRLDMVEFLLNANALSASAYSDGKHYDRAIEEARRRGNFAIADLIRKHSADRQGWGTANEQKMGTMVLGDDEKLLPAIQGNSRATHDLQVDKQRRPITNGHIVECPYQNEKVSYDLVCSIMAQSKRSFKIKEIIMTGAEATDVRWPGVMEESEAEPLLSNTGHEDLRGEPMDTTADTSFGPWEVSSGQGGEFHQPEGQSWDEDERRNDGTVVSRTLATDVFMGFAEDASL